LLGDRYAVRHIDHDIVVAWNMQHLIKDLEGRCCISQARLSRQIMWANLVIEKNGSEQISSRAKNDLVDCGPNR
jgi:hypothetical protein